MWPDRYPTDVLQKNPGRMDALGGARCLQAFHSQVAGMNFCGPGHNQLYG